MIYIVLQVTGIPVVFVSALEGKGRMDVMREVVDTYEKWCLRLPTARLNRWLRKVSFLFPSRILAVLPTELDGIHGNCTWCPARL